MSENKNNNQTNEVRGSRTSFLIVCIIAIALAVAVVVMGLHMSGVFGGGQGSSGGSGSSSAQSSAASSSSSGSSDSASSGKASSAASSSASSAAASSASSGTSLPPMDEGGQDKAFSEISPVIDYISKTAQPGTMGADEKITMCAARLLDTLFSSNCSPADFREAALSYKEEKGVSDDLREQLYSVIKSAASFSDEAAAKKALNGTGITSKSPWNEKTFEKLFSFASGLGFDTASLVR